MPTYEYGCQACGATWELEQRISEAPIKKCPKCGKKKAQRLISGGTGVIFKGGGWYADLYHKPAGGSAKESEPSGDSSSSSDSSASSSETKSESKSETKSETKSSSSESKPKKKKAASK
ncbi:MAG: FmdB family zinc ribbon protein [Sandaracinaceae bacterium]